MICYIKMYCVTNTTNGHYLIHDGKKGLDIICTRPCVLCFVLCSSQKFY